MSRVTRQRNRKRKKTLRIDLLKDSVLPGTVVRFLCACTEALQRNWGWRGIFLRTYKTQRYRVSTHFFEGQTCSTRAWGQPWCPLDKAVPGMSLSVYTFLISLNDGRSSKPEAAMIPDATTAFNGNVLEWFSGIWRAEKGFSWTVESQKKRIFMG